MEKNEACQGNREHVFGDSRFSFKPAGCHLQNYKNASKVVFLSISSNKEFSVHREDASRLIPILYWLLKSSKLPAMSYLSRGQSKPHTNINSPQAHLWNPQRVEIDFKKESQEEPGEVTRN